ncbi:MAG: hypothetical protein IPK83_07395 [Planctomycetes bacterium]|nr:hypothetical protein [Planctomycetota bacterium]
MQLAKLKAIGERHDVDYQYVEWLSGLTGISEVLGSGSGMGSKLSQEMGKPAPQSFEDETDISHGRDAHAPQNITSTGDSQSIDPRGPVVIELKQVREADSHR